MGELAKTNDKLLRQSDSESAPGGNAVEPSTPIFVIVSKSVASAHEPNSYLPTAEPFIPTGDCLMPSRIKHQILYLYNKDQLNQSE